MPAGGPTGLRRRGTARRGRAVVVAVVGVLALLTLASPPTTAATSTATPPGPDGYSVQLGPEHSMFGPSSYIDMPFHAIRDNSGLLRGYIGNINTYELKSGQFPRPVLKHGATGAIDQCGSWLMGSIYKDPRNTAHWVGWYHAESAPNADKVCRYSGGRARWSMAYTESWDAGQTWRRPTFGHATNQVVTQDTALLGDNLTDDAGNGRVVVHAGYFYMFYMAATRSTRTRVLNVARAPLSSLGHPGSWRKYRCSKTLLGTYCGFGQPGLGGISTSISLPTKARHVTWNSYLQRWVGIEVSGRTGFFLWESSDLLHWSQHRMLYPPVSTSSDATVDVWSDRTSTDRGLYGYPSIAGANLDPNVTGQSFRLYYMRIYPGEGMTRRYLIWRTVSLVPSTGVVDEVALTTYRSLDGHRRTTTELPKPAFGTTVDATAGYLLADAQDGFAPLFECQQASGDEYLRQNACGTGEAMIRRMGYISKARSTLAPTPLYRCVDTALGAHFASIDPACAGKRPEFVIGYVLKPLA